MNNIRKPLVEKLIAFNNKNSTSFHVPGHKNSWLSTLPEEMKLALTYDFTELEGLDDLHEPTGVIKEAEEQLAVLYNVKRSFFLINGTTVGNLAMIYATCKYNEPVLVQRNAHKSIFNAIELVGAIPIFIEPLWSDTLQTSTYVQTSLVEKALYLYPKATAIILTYPTYYGIAGNELENIIEKCHNHSIPVLIDEAHGAHFVIGEPFPKSAIQLGADIVVQSAHKTLPAMTMASYLHYNSKIVCEKEIIRYLGMLQSSSPSYLLMASLDDARAYVEGYTEGDVSYLMKERKYLITNLSKLDKVTVVEVDDPLKLLIRIKGLTGVRLQEQLQKHNIYVELADPYQVLLILPLLKNNQQYAFQRLIEILKNIALTIQVNSESHSFPLSLKKPTISKAIYNAAQIKKYGSNWVSFNEVEGRIAAATIIPYPPGIPLLLAGEKITAEHLNTLNTLISLNVHFQGEINNKDKALKVIKKKVKDSEE